MKSHNSFTNVLIALGANVTSPVGPPVQTVLAGMSAIPNDSIKLVAKSRLYVTPCVPEGAGPDYVNAVVSVRTRLSALDLLQHLHQVEAAFARERTNRWAARTLDLDLLDFGGALAPDPATYGYWRDLPTDRQAEEAPGTLILPHPRLEDRAFVLVPLADIAPHWVHPITGARIGDLLSRLKTADRAAVRPIEP